jgi:hypothetical protein
VDDINELGPASFRAFAELLLQFLPLGLLSLVLTLESFNRWTITSTGSRYCGVSYL